MTPRAAAALGAALAALLASSAVAQTEDLLIETTEGSFEIRLFDHPDLINHPDLAEHIVQFRRHYPIGSQSFFHRSENECTTCFLCECSIDGVCQNDELERSCDPEQSPSWIGPDGGACTTQDGSICFFCECGSDGICQNDELDRSCNPPEESYWIDPDGEALTSPVLYTGRFLVDDHNHITENQWLSTVRLPDPDPEALDAFLMQPGIFENNPRTVAFVRDQDTLKLTGEWIINLSEDTHRFDFFLEGDSRQDAMKKAYLVFGMIFGDSSALGTIAGYRTHDARQDVVVVADFPELEPARKELDRVPVLDAFEASSDPFIEPCDDPDYPDCKQCMQTSEDALRCEQPVCLELVPLTDEQQQQVDDGMEVQRFCAGPVLQSFPLFVPEPSSVGLQVSALLALAALAALAARGGGPAGVPDRPRTPGPRSVA